MERTTRQTLEATVARIAKCAAHIGYPAYGYEIDHMAGGYRLVTAGGGRDVSPRLPGKAFAEWLDGFEEALSEIEHAMNHAAIEARHA